MILHCCVQIYVFFVLCGLYIRILSNGFWQSRVLQYHNIKDLCLIFTQHIFCNFLHFNQWSADHCQTANISVLYTYYFKTSYILCFFLGIYLVLLNISASQRIHILGGWSLRSSNCVTGPCYKPKIHGRWISDKLFFAFFSVIQFV